MGTHRQSAQRTERGCHLTGKPRFWIANSCKRLSRQRQKLAWLSVGSRGSLLWGEGQCAKDAITDAVRRGLGAHSSSQELKPDVMSYLRLAETLESRKRATREVKTQQLVNYFQSNYSSFLGGHLPLSEENGLFFQAAWVVVTRSPGRPWSSTANADVWADLHAR